jgi:hypothetical protein
MVWNFAKDGGLKAIDRGKYRVYEAFNPPYGRK